MYRASPAAVLAAVGALHTRHVRSADGARVAAAVFGMNLVSGLEEEAGMFWPVAGMSVAVGLAAYATLVTVHTVWPRLSWQRCRNDMAALQELLMFNVDDIGDVIASLRRARRECAAPPLPM